jgi:Na+/citrate or Na+/malate symporter
MNTHRKHKFSIRPLGWVFLVFSLAVHVFDVELRSDVYEHIAFTTHYGILFHGLGEEKPFVARGIGGRVALLATHGNVPRRTSKHSLHI